MILVTPGAELLGSVSGEIENARICRPPNNANDMSRKGTSATRVASAMILGVGSFAYSTAQIFKEAGAEVATYLTRDYSHYPPSLAGPTYSRETFPSPAPLIKQHQIDLLIPMSIDWSLAPWKDELLASGAAIFCATGEAMRIERERDFARQLCRDFKVPFPQAHIARNRLEAQEMLQQNPEAYVIKNPLCSPTSPVHTIVCETLQDTRAWLNHIDYAEGVFLQKYLGRAEAGHIAFISGGEIYPLVTNQEYKRAFAGNMGIVAGAPLGGLVEKDPEDKYGLARELLHPLLPWFRKVNFHGPIQVTAVHCHNRWHVIEYNIRIGVTSGAMLLRLLQNPAQVVLATAQNKTLDLQFRDTIRFGCSVTLAGYGYPYVQMGGPELPVNVSETFDCDVWWNEVAVEGQNGLKTTGHRIADIVAFGSTLAEATAKAYSNIRKIRCLGSYYREDIGRSLWPPGTV